MVQEDLVYSYVFQGMEEKDLVVQEDLVDLEGQQRHMSVLVEVGMFPVVDMGCRDNTDTAMN